MTRYLFPGDLILLPSGDPAASFAFTIWDARTGGNDVTSTLTAPDGVTAYTATTDSLGQQLAFRGPDTWRKRLYRDTGTGQRYTLESVEVSDEIVDDIAALQTAVTALQAGAGLDTEAVQDAVNNFLIMGSGMSKVYDDAGNTLTISSTAAVSLANAPAGYTHSVSFTAAAAAANRAAITPRSDIYIRIFGGTDSDTDPTWMIDGDYRDLIPAGG